MTTRLSLFSIALVAIGCSPAATDGHTQETTEAAPSSAASVPAPTETASSASASASSAPGTGSATPPSAPSGPPSAPPLPPGAAFTYTEGDISIAFTSPNKVALVGSAKACAYELSDNGNMYSGKEIEAAWRDAEAQSAVSASKAFLSPADLTFNAEVRGPNGRIAWTPLCGGLCVAGPKGVTALLHVLHVLAVNARGVCKP